MEASLEKEGKMSMPVFAEDKGVFQGKVSTGETETDLHKRRETVTRDKGVMMLMIRDTGMMSETGMTRDTGIHGAGMMKETGMTREIGTRETGMTREATMIVERKRAQAVASIEKES
jgi:hypothetical protein